MSFFAAQMVSLAHVLSVKDRAIAERGAFREEARASNSPKAFQERCRIVVPALLEELKVHGPAATVRLAEALDESRHFVYLRLVELEREGIVRRRGGSSRPQWLLESDK